MDPCRTLKDIVQLLFSGHTMNPSVYESATVLEQVWDCLHCSSEENDKVMALCRLMYSMNLILRCLQTVDIIVHVQANRLEIQHFRPVQP